MNASPNITARPAAVWVPLRRRRFCQIHDKVSMWEAVRHSALLRFGACQECGRAADGFHSKPHGPLYCGPQCCPDCAKTE